MRWSCTKNREQQQQKRQETSQRVQHCGTSDECMRTVASSPAMHDLLQLKHNLESFAQRSRAPVEHGLMNIPFRRRFSEDGTHASLGEEFLNFDKLFACL